MSPSSEIAPAKPPRPAPSTLHSQPQAHQPPELPQKSLKKKSGDANQRSSTESSGSDGTEQVEQVINQELSMKKCSQNSSPPSPSLTLCKGKMGHYLVAVCLVSKTSSCKTIHMKVFSAYRVFSVQIKLLFILKVFT